MVRCGVMWIGCNGLNFQVTSLVYKEVLFTVTMKSPDSILQMLLVRVLVVLLLGLGLELGNAQFTIQSRNTQKFIRPGSQGNLTQWERDQLTVSKLLLSLNVHKLAFVVVD
jgi:uncharacterized membrane protein YjgN (DUF898 family)